jgi:uncharacterized protein (DUF305 family)
MAPEKSVSLRGRPVAAVAVIVIAVAIAAFTGGRLSAPVASAPSTTSAEAGFARDMQTHHAQAVELSLIVRDLTDDPEVRLMAYDIATTQAQQEGQMFGWLSVWNLPQAPAEAPMTWMARPALGGTGHEHAPALIAAGDPMPGYATEEQIAELKSLSGVAAEKDFLSLMIAHHRGGVEMAQALLDRSTDAVVTVFAQRVVTNQSAEITALEDMLAARS